MTITSPRLSLNSIMLTVSNSAESVKIGKGDRRCTILQTKGLGFWAYNPRGFIQNEHMASLSTTASHMWKLSRERWAESVKSC